MGWTNDENSNVKRQVNNIIIGLSKLVRWVRLAEIILHLQEI